MYYVSSQTQAIINEFLFSHNCCQAISDQEIVGNVALQVCIIIGIELLRLDINQVARVF